MQLSKFTDYSLRTLLHLAATGDTLMSTKNIADIHDARYNHLAKVTQWLANEGYIRTQRGRAGGMELALKPEKINIGTITRKLEQKSALVECMQADGGNCKLSPACGLSVALNSAREAFFDVLDGYSLADLISAQPQMINLLLTLHEDQ
ncbi:MAG: Rrf2 family transcriptional regulator [Sneathiellales bacterium]|nr:Rrf2 family transcriptional regulator [Sneathiellales bacterium]